MEGEERETRKRLFMDLYSRLLCFPFTIKQYKMKESEHKKSTHKIILNFNKKKEKQREERNIAQLSAGDDFMTFMLRERVSAFVPNQAPSHRYVPHTLDCDALNISTRFSCSLILCIGRLGLSCGKSLVRFWWLMFFHFVL